MAESVPMTEKGRAILQKELEALEAKAPAIRKAIGEAREKGDLSENAEYHAARESLGMLEARTNELRGMIARGQIVDPRRAPRGKVAFGATVKVLDLKSKEKQVFQLVGAGEDDASEGRILTTSPFAQGIMLRKVGDEVAIALPRGKARYRILKITYPG
jgi:transcription elongation factor GreA